MLAKSLVVNISSKRRYRSYFLLRSANTTTGLRQAAIACGVACPGASRYCANGRLVLTCSEPTLVSNVRVPLLVINLPVYVSCLCNFMSGGIVSGH